MLRPIPRDCCQFWALQALAAKRSTARQRQGQGPACQPGSTVLSSGPSAGPNPQRPCPRTAPMVLHSRPSPIEWRGRWPEGPPKKGGRGGLAGLAGSASSAGMQGVRGLGRAATAWRKGRNFAAHLCRRRPWPRRRRQTARAGTRQRLPPRRRRSACAGAWGRQSLRGGAAGRCRAGRGGAGQGGAGA